MFRISNGVLKKAGKEPMAFHDNYESFLKFYPECGQQLLLSLIKEKIPDFKPHPKKRKPN
jgi:hypothetical protein